MKKWIEAARLRTLPLSISGIILGGFIAFEANVFNGQIFLFSVLTTIGLQVLSNFANDYGDGVKGTDNEERIGPQRAIQAGVITPKAMFRAIVWTAIITFIVALYLIYISFGVEKGGLALLFILLGILSIAAAIKYTMGKNPYGYSGLGDLFVFLFFGLLSVLGSQFLHTKLFEWDQLLLAAAIGFLSAAVLNLNNMRDQISDKTSNKNTLVVKMGFLWAKRYHAFLIIAPLLCGSFYLVLQGNTSKIFLVLIPYVFLADHLAKVLKNNKPEALDPELKKVALSTLLVAILIGWAIIL